MTTMTYEGGIPAISVVLPHRVLSVQTGDTVEVTPDEAKRLKPLPGWKAVKTPSDTREAFTDPEPESKEDN